MTRVYIYYIRLLATNCFVSIGANMKRYLLILFLLIVGISNAPAQISLTEIEPEGYFDFWIGQWDLQWKASDGTIERGTNKIEKILDGKVIKEHFEATVGEMDGYIGKSYSVYNEQTNQWKQTWVDNQGAYLDFVGKFEDNDRIFLRHSQDSSGTSIIQRMVFYDISQDQFSWRWEKSTDDGKSWHILWEIAYRRHGK